MKTCTKCNIEKPKDMFSKHCRCIDGLSDWCKDCQRVYNKLYRESNKNKLKEHYKQYYENNKEQIKQKQKDRDSNRKLEKTEYQKQYYKNNKEKLKNYRKDYYETNKEVLKIKQKEYQRKNRVHTNNYIKQRKQSEPLYKLSRNIRSLIIKSIKRGGFTKKSRSLSLLGCTFEELVKFLGTPPNADYHLDHICPCAQAQNEEELIKLQHYSNFRWLSPGENISKSDKPTEDALTNCKKILGRDWIFKII